jgi:hypothetical protein
MFFYFFFVYFSISLFFCFLFKFEKQNLFCKNKNSDGDELGDTREPFVSASVRRLVAEQFMSR